MTQRALVHRISATAPDDVSVDIYYGWIFYASSDEVDDDGNFDQTKARFGADCANPADSTQRSTS